MNWANFLPASASAGFKPMGASTGNKRADADPNAASAADPESYADNCMLQQAASMLVGQAQAASLLLEQAKFAGILVDSPPSDLGPMSSDGFRLPQPPNTSFSGELPQPPRGAQNSQQSSQQLFAGIMLPTADQVFTPPPGTPATAWSLGLNAGLSAGLAASANIQQNGAMSPFLQAFASQFESKKTPGVGNMNAPFMAPSFATQSSIPNPAAGQPSGGGSFSGGSGAFGGTFCTDPSCICLDLPPPPRTPLRARASFLGFFPATCHCFVLRVKVISLRLTRCLTFGPPPRETATSLCRPEIGGALVVQTKPGSPLRYGVLQRGAAGSARCAAPAAEGYARGGRFQRPLGGDIHSGRVEVLLQKVPTQIGAEVRYQEALPHPHQNEAVQMHSVRSEFLRCLDPEPPHQGPRRPGPAQVPVAWVQQAVQPQVQHGASHQAGPPRRGPGRRRR